MPLPIPRRYSKVQLPIHFVWATIDRRPILIPAIERHAYRIIENKAQQLKTTVLALGGMPDHIHLAVLFSPNITIAAFVQQVKRAANNAINESYGDKITFAWNPGYSAFAFPYGRRQIVIDYINHQKTHHANAKTINDWEEIGELKVDDQ